MKFVKNQAREVTLAHTLVEVTNSGDMARIEREIAWKRPNPGWMKFNTDGASCGNPGLAAAGGVIRDKSGSWLRGFALNTEFSLHHLLNCGVCTMDW